MLTIKYLPHITLLLFAAATVCTAQVDPKAVFRGLRPEETTKANDPALRPL